VHRTQHHTPIAGHPGRWKHWSSSPAITVAANSATLAYVKTCDPVSGLRFSDAVQTGGSTRSQLRRTAGMSQCGFHCGTSRLAGYDAVMMGGLVGKRAHFIPTNTTITALERQTVYTMSELHGLPRRVSPIGVAVCGRVHPRVVQAAWYHLFNDYGLSPTSGWTDERVNQAGAVSPSLVNSGKMTG